MDGFATSSPRYGKLSIDMAVVCYRMGQNNWAHCCKLMRNETARCGSAPNIGNVDTARYDVMPLVVTIAALLNVL